MDGSDYYVTCIYNLYMELTFDTFRLYNERHRVHGGFYPPKGTERVKQARTAA